MSDKPINAKTISELHDGLTEIIDKSSGDGVRSGGVETQLDGSIMERDPKSHR